MTKPETETKVNYAQVHREAVRLVHQFRNLIAFAEQVGEVAAWESTSAEIKQRLEQLKGEEAAARARVDAAAKEATDVIAAAKRKADELIAAATRRADEKTAAAEAAAARLARDSDELTSVGAQLAAMRAEIDGLKAKFNN
jgi:hypothetical protein